MTATPLPPPRAVGCPSRLVAPLLPLFRTSPVPEPNVADTRPVALPLLMLMVSPSLVGVASLDR